MSNNLVSVDSHFGLYKYKQLIIGYINKLLNKKHDRCMMVEWGCPKSRIAPFAIVYFGKKYYLTVAKTKHYSNG
ncbi:hypothetical protein, partial [Parabacteroides sp. merdae-related_45_40]|uniref:hypothetical protein n=1 Tax=Parabacteroides sp. merdae-related_45_40 TaxID=1897013 RepID=UPI00257B189C